MIALELEVISRKLDRFGWERDRGSAAHDRIVTDWMDALQDYPLDEVKEACRRHVRSNPTKTPNEGHIIAELGRIRKAKAEVFKAKNPQPEPEPNIAPVSKEKAAAILEEFGFSVKRMGEQ